MFITIFEIGSTLYNIQVVDDCWNVYENINTNNPKAIYQKLEEMYQCD